MDGVGTPLQQDFKDLYREAYLAETRYVGEGFLHKSVSAGRVARME